MDVKPKLDIWKNAIMGIGLDVDRQYGNQCADVILSWGMTLFPNTAWTVLFKPTASMKDLHTVANRQYFDWIPNDHNNPNQLPVAGDIAVFAAQNAEQRKKGYYSTYDNPDGHAGVVDRADTSHVYLIQQDGSQAQTVVQLRARAWRLTECLGWLRPRITAPAIPRSTGPVNHPLIGRDVWFKPIAGKDKNWSVYRVGQFPDRAKRIGAVRPDYFKEGPNGAPGFVKRIQGVSQYANTVTIHTDTYGLVDIYLDGDAQIL